MHLLEEKSKSELRFVDAADDDGADDDAGDDDGGADDDAGGQWSTQFSET